MKAIISICFIISILICGTAFGSQVELTIGGVSIDEISNDNKEPLKSMPGEEFAEMIGVTYNAKKKTLEGGETSIIIAKQPLVKNRYVRTASNSFATISTFWHYQNMVLLYAWADINIQIPGDFEIWFVKIMPDETVYYKQWGGGWTTQVTPLYQELDPAAMVGHYYMSCLEPDWLAPNSDVAYYYGVDDNPNGIFDGTLVYDLIDSVEQ